MSALLLTLNLSAQIFITEVVDGTLTGAAPKWVEITNTGGSDFTFGTGGGLLVLTNGSADLTVDVDMTGITILAGSSVTVSADNTGQAAIFQDVYGFAPTYTGGGATFGNGDDGYALAADGTGAGVASFMDIYGVYQEDGTGMVWEYTDGYSYRTLGLTDGNAGTFDPGNWVYGGVNSLEAVFEGDNSYDPLEIVLLQNYTTPGAYAVPEPSAFAMLAGISGLALILLRRIRRRK